MRFLVRYSIFRCSSMLAFVSMVLGLLFHAAECNAQQMRIEGFSRVRASIIKQTKPVVDKQFALIDLSTEQKGFTFMADGKNKATAEEGDGIITVKVPHKTRYVTVKHPDFGQYTWRVPGKGLRKKRHYRATLFANTADKEYRLGWQWVQFGISPENAVLHIDSTTYLIRDGGKTLRLPVGKHTYQVESPFYQAVNDTFVLTDTTKLRLTVSLQPTYSYLTVMTPMRKAEIRIDGQPIGRGTGVSRRLAEGKHRLAVYVRGICYYDEPFTIGRSEKKTIVLTEPELQPKQPTKKHRKSKEPSNQVVKQPGGQAISAPVTLNAADDSTEIWLNREKVGVGKWSGMLDEGFYIVTTRKDRVDSEVIQFWITDESPLELNLAVPETSMGMLNIYSNVEGAEIYIDGKCVGETPCVVKGLPTSRDCVVTIVKQGYKKVRKKVRPRGNDLTDVYVRLKGK